MMQDAGCKIQDAGCRMQDAARRHDWDYSKSRSIIACVVMRELRSRSVCLSTIKSVGTGAELPHNSVNDKYSESPVHFHPATNVNRLLNSTSLYALNVEEINS